MVMMWFKKLFVLRMKLYFFGEDDDDDDVVYMKNETKFF